MRDITDHVVENDAANHQLKISVLDEPGAGGANHVYGLSGMDFTRNKAAMETPDDRPEGDVSIIFQCGPIPENGVNGVTQEALLSIVIDRLRSFQVGQFSCRENAIALTHCEDALMWLQRRTRARIKRGVEGTHQK